MPFVPEFWLDRVACLSDAFRFRILATLWSVRRPPCARFVIGGRHGREGWCRAKASARAGRHTPTARPRRAEATRAGRVVAATQARAGPGDDRDGTTVAARATSKTASTTPKATGPARAGAKHRRHQVRRRRRPARPAPQAKTATKARATRPGEGGRQGRPARAAAARPPRQDGSVDEARPTAKSTDRGEGGEVDSAEDDDSPAATRAPRDRRRRKPQRRRTAKQARGAPAKKRQSPRNRAIGGEDTPRRSEDDGGVDRSRASASGGRPSAETAPDSVRTPTGTTSTPPRRRGQGSDNGEALRTEADAPRRRPRRVPASKRSGTTATKVAPRPERSAAETEKIRVALSERLGRVARRVRLDRVRDHRTAARPADRLGR